ncbi:UNVERIFIED_CONTAM: hypothetical protein K2H54_042786 [Gekko kuhli]
MLAHTHGSGARPGVPGHDVVGPGGCGGNRGGPGPLSGCSKRSTWLAMAMEDPRAWLTVPEKEALCLPPAEPGRLLGPAAAAEPTWTLGQPATTGKEALARPVLALRNMLTQDATAVTALAIEAVGILLGHILTKVIYFVPDGLSLF